MEYFDYNRTVIGYHGTTRAAANLLVSGIPFGASSEEDEWLGHGVYFWEYGPRQAWWWADRKSGRKRWADQQKAPAVVGAMIRLGNCLDLLDPPAQKIAKDAYNRLKEDLKEAGKVVPRNVKQYKRLDCAVFQQIYEDARAEGAAFDSCRGVFIPGDTSKSGRLWPTSGVWKGAHIQLCVRNPDSILAVWPVRRDGHYGVQEQQETVQGGTGN